MTRKHTRWTLADLVAGIVNTYMTMIATMQPIVICTPPPNPPCFERKVA